MGAREWEAAAAGSREAAWRELGTKWGGEVPARQTIEHAAAAALVSIAFDLGRISAVLEAWQESTAWSGGQV